jgi:hypothetical protein
MENKVLENINPWQKSQGYFFAAGGGTPAYPIRRGVMRIHEGESENLR